MYCLLWTYLALMGLVMVFSASAIVAGNRFQDPEFFLKRQIAWLGFGFLLMHLTSRIDYPLWKKLSMPILISMAILLVMVLVLRWASRPRAPGAGFDGVPFRSNRRKW